MSNFETIKCVVIGDEKVGKTSLIIKSSRKQFQPEYIPKKADNYSLLTKFNSKTIQIGFWDTISNDESNRLRPLSYAKTDIFLVCFSLSSRSSFENVESKWIPEIKLYSPNVPFILVGTKKDLRANHNFIQNLKNKNQLISSKQARKLAKKLDAFQYIEVSVLSHQNISKVVDETIRSVLYPESKKKKSLRKLNDEKKCSIL
ncbi:rho-related gtp-binding protein rhog [Anaeramoeba ignava]|uniref:Rho-related gtp-binding protein rhog n=1 Tax=Anaeramoeba ignava TaxID=1746090 RepID=A0A9Q0LDL1_ANAIG|nr:rho-related gtp-binding protein rhog [Anaeramoeba ignava]